MASADKPFRFPATFTFVVRSFTVLDGIGKGLDPRFDISEIAAPYARGLLLEGNPQYAALAKDFRRRVGLQVQKICQLNGYPLAMFSRSFFTFGWQSNASHATCYNTLCAVDLQNQTLLCELWELRVLRTGHLEFHC